jgi:hypothetical protein
VVINDPSELRGEARGHRAVIVPLGNARIRVLEECGGKARALPGVAVSGRGSWVWRDDRGHPGSGRAECVILAGQHGQRRF